MYESFFQFKSHPFPAVPEISNYFPAQSMEAARQTLVRVVERAEGPALVVGPAGVGKTLLLRVLADHFAHDFRVVMLSGTRVKTRRALMQSILFELNLPYLGLDEGELRLALIDTLRRTETVPTGLLLLLDEAQVMSLKVLDEVRLITNVTHNGATRVRLVVAGDPRLEEHFTSPVLESFNQRIAARCYLQPFTRDETLEYVRAEVSWAGGDPGSLFPEPTVRAVHLATDGIPRLINQICDRALVLTHALGQTQVDSVRIREAWADVQQLPPPWETPRSTPPAAVSDVIEFGQLDDDFPKPVPAGQPIGNSEGLTASRVADPCVAWNDSPCDATELRQSGSFDASFDSASVTIQSPYSTEPVEWICCGDPAAEVEPVRRIEVDPFVDHFDEEITVIEKTFVRTLEDFRGRPRVSCAEGRDISISLQRIQEAAGMVLDTPETEPVVTPVSSREAPPSFEFSTLQDFPAIDLHGEFLEPSPFMSAAGRERVELDFDDEIESVPFPWMRRPSFDDREIIIVEETAPQPELCAVENGNTSDSAPRAEYRDLFANLRRVRT